MKAYATGLVLVGLSLIIRVTLALAGVESFHSVFLPLLVLLLGWRYQRASGLRRMALLCMVLLCLLLFCYNVLWCGFVSAIVGFRVPPLSYLANAFSFLCCSVGGALVRLETRVGAAAPILRLRSILFGLFLALVGMGMLIGVFMVYQRVTEAVIDRYFSGVVGQR